MDFLQKLRCNLLATAGVNLFKYVLFYWTENTNVSVFFVPTLENVGARALSDLNSNSWVCILLSRQTGFPARLQKTGAADQHVF